jgi:hypothetical protein
MDRRFLDCLFFRIGLDGADHAGKIAFHGGYVYDHPGHASFLLFPAFTWLKGKKGRRLSLRAIGPGLGTHSLFLYRRVMEKLDGLNPGALKEK